MRALNQNIDVYHNIRLAIMHAAHVRARVRACGVCLCVVD